MTWNVVTPQYCGYTLLIYSSNQSIKFVTDLKKNLDLTTKNMTKQYQHNLRWTTAQYDS